MAYYYHIDLKTGEGQAVHELNIEHRTVPKEAVSSDLAKHLHSRMMCGAAAIVCDRPAPYKSVLRKKWLRVIRQVQRERSSTLDAARIAELTGHIEYMAALQFSVKPDDYLADMQISTPAQFMRTAPVVMTLYVVIPVSKQQLVFITALMLPGSLVVIYNLPVNGESDK